jgi:hypothetical protein
MSERRDKLEAAAADMVAVLKDELAALQIWQSAKTRQGSLALPDDVWDGMSISRAKIERVVREAGIANSRRSGKGSRLRGK